MSALPEYPEGPGDSPLFKSYWFIYVKTTKVRDTWYLTHHGITYQLHIKTISYKTQEWGPARERATRVRDTWKTQWVEPDHDMKYQLWKDVIQDTKFRNEDPVKPLTEREFSKVDEALAVAVGCMVGQRLDHIMSLQAGLLHPLLHHLHSLHCGHWVKVAVDPHYISSYKNWFSLL